MKWTLGIQAEKSYYPNITCRACCHCARLGTLRYVKHSRSKTTLFKQGATNNFITSHPSCQMTRGAGTENSHANRLQQKTDEAG
jgi:hypothetical protein